MKRLINAQYTEVLQNLLDDPIINEKIMKAMSTYPLYVCTSEDENVRALIPTREELNNKILNFYKYREIGFESVGRFIDELEISLVEIMPYYNQMFQTVQFLGDVSSPFDNVDMEETYEETRVSKSEGEIINKTVANGKDVVTGTSKAEAHNTDKAENTTTNTENSKNVHSATPQGSLSIPAVNYDDDKTNDIPFADEIDHVRYADDANWDKKKNDASSLSEGENNSTSESESESTRLSENDATSENSSTGLQEDTIRHTYKRKGNQGVTTYGHDIIKHRKAIMNIEQEIIRDRRIRELFMTVF